MANHPMWLTMAENWNHVPGHLLQRPMRVVSVRSLRLLSKKESTCRERTRDDFAIVGDSSELASVRNHHRSVDGGRLRQRVGLDSTVRPSPGRNQLVGGPIQVTVQHFEPGAGWTNFYAQVMVRNNGVSVVEFDRADIELVIVDSGISYFHVTKDKSSVCRSNSA
jgi:hypothetical protein